jgi:tetratricopeptide (TPR) repeat protein
MHRYVGVLLVLILLTGFSGHATADDQSDCKLSIAERRIAACTRLITKREGISAAERAEAYANRAQGYRVRDDIERAVADLTNAAETDPARAASYRGSIHAIRGEHELALAQFEQAIKANASDARAYNSRGNTRNAAGDRDGAIADFNEAVRLDPKYTAAHLNRADAYIAKKNLILALADASEAIRLEHNYPGGYTIRGQVYRMQGETDRGIADLTKAIELDPKLTRAYLQRGLAYASKGEHDRAIADMTVAIKINPKDGAAYNERGYAYTQKKERELAFADFNKAIELNPKLAGAYNNRGVYYSNGGDADRALAEYNKAIELNPMFALAFNNRGHVYLNKGSLDLAIVDFDKSIELDPAAGRTYANRATAYEKKGDAERALADLRKILELPVVLEADKQRQEIARARIARVAEPPRTRRPVTPLPSKPSKLQRVALVIGNSQYTHAGRLTNPKNDASGVAASLRRLAFEQVFELYDLSREQMGKALKDFGDVAETAEWAVVFFAGHGIEMNGVTYLIPTDAALKRDAHVTDEAISLTQVQAKVDAASKLGLVILDSCRNNPFTERMVRSGGAARSIGRGLANIEPEGNVLVAYSAKHGTTASDGTGPNSPFTEALLNYIEEPGLEINFLFRKVRDQVRTNTQRRQEPFLYGSLSSELLYFKAVAAR